MLQAAARGCRRAHHQGGLPLVTAAARAAGKRPLTPPTGSGPASIAMFARQRLLLLPAGDGFVVRSKGASSSGSSSRRGLTTTPSSSGSAASTGNKPPASTSVSSPASGGGGSGGGSGGGGVDGARAAKAGVIGAWMWILMFSRSNLDYFDRCRVLIVSITTNG